MEGDGSQRYEYREHREINESSGGTKGALTGPKFVRRTPPAIELQEKLNVEYKKQVGLDLDTNETAKNSGRKEISGKKSQRGIDLINRFIQLNVKEANEMDQETFKELHILMNGRDKVYTDSYGQGLLHEVARVWDTKLAEKLLTKPRKFPINLKDCFDWTALHVAAAENRVEMINCLLENNANREARTLDNQTPLHIAALFDSDKACEALLAKNANVEAVDFLGRNPLHLASEFGQRNSATTLLRWKKAKTQALAFDKSGQSCMSLIIANMPFVASEALDHFVVPDPKTHKRSFYLDLLEHCQKPGSDDNPHTETPLQSIVKYRRGRVIVHPVIKQMLKYKWERYGRLYAWRTTLLNLLFVMLWTILGVGVPWYSRPVYDFPTGGWIVTCWILALAMTVGHIVNEIKEIIKLRNRHKKWRDGKRDRLREQQRRFHKRRPEGARMIGKEIVRLNQMSGPYFRDPWNYLDWGVYILHVVLLILHLVDVAAYTADTRPPPCCGNEGCTVSANLIRNGSITIQEACNQGHVNNASLSAWHNRIFVVTIIFMWMRLMKNMRGFRAIGPFVVMLGKVLKDILNFLFLYLEFYIPYACAFWMIFGGIASIHSTITVDRVLFTLFRITLVDDYQFEEMQSFDIVMAYALCGSFLAFSAILCINLLIALLSDSFQRVHHNARTEASMQQAILILQAEDSKHYHDKQGMSKLSNRLRGECSPKVEDYYEEDEEPLRGSDSALLRDMKRKMDDIYAILDKPPKVKNPKQDHCQEQEQIVPTYETQMEVKTREKMGKNKVQQDPTIHIERSPIHDVKTYDIFFGQPDEASDEGRQQPAGAGPTDSDQRLPSESPNKRLPSESPDMGTHTEAPSTSQQ